MIPVKELSDIRRHEKEIEGKHVIMILFARPDLKSCEEIIRQFDYFYELFKGYCTIYVPGYSFTYSDNETKQRIYEVIGPQGTTWYYTNKWFIGFIEDLKNRIKWEYSGEAQLIILQNGEKDGMNFRSYINIDIEYGIKKEYIDSFPRFMERLHTACKSEVDAIRLVNKANQIRISPRKILENVLNMDTKLPVPISKIINDKAFYAGKKGN